MKQKGNIFLQYVKNKESKIVKMCIETNTDTIYIELTNEKIDELIELLKEARNKK